MSIEEKPRALEFSYVPDEMKNISEEKQVAYNISYDPSVFGEIFPVKISSGDDEMKFTIEFFEQVSEFFREKGILKSKIFIPNKDIPIRPVTSSVPPPVIQKKERGTSPLSDPLMTFDISAQQNVSEEEEKPSDTSTASGPIVSSETPKEVINRPVIRTRVREGDVKSAEKDAAILRGSPSQKRVIKRANSKEEE